MSNLWTHIAAFANVQAWLVKIVIVILLGLTASWLENCVYRRLTPRLSGTPHAWDDTLLEALRKPLQLYIWALVFSLVVPVLLYQFNIGTQYIQYFSTGRKLLFILALLWFLLRYITFVEQKAIKQQHSHKHKRNLSSIRAVAQLSRILFVVVALITAVQTLGFPVSSFLAVGGIGALAISLAAKDTLANFFGGLMIFWDRPFTVGDWIRSPDRNIEGTVEHIGWRLTRIRTFDKRPLYVPNGSFSVISIENPSRMQNRRIKTIIGLRYDDANKVSVILADIETMLRNHPEIDTNLTLFVKLIEFGASSLNVLVYTFTKTTDWVSFQSIQQDVFLKIIDIIAKHGAECAFPTTTVHVPEGIMLKQ